MPQGGPVPAKDLQQGLYLFTSAGGSRQRVMVAAVALLYLGSMTFFAAHEASFGLRVAVVEPAATT